MSYFQNPIASQSVINALLAQRLKQQPDGIVRQMPQESPEQAAQPSLLDQRQTATPVQRQEPPQTEMVQDVAQTPNLADQRTMPAARSSSGPAPYPFTPLPQYHDAHQPDDHLSFMDRLGHFAKSAGLGFMRGGVGGAIAGGIGGAVDPNFWHRAKFHYGTMPLAQQRFANESAMANEQSTLADQEVGRRHQIASLTGIDPDTDQPTLSADEHKLQREALEHQRATLQYNKDRDYEFKNKKFDFDAQYKQHRLEQFQQRIDQGQTVKTIGADGNTYIVDKGDPTNAIMVTRKDGTPVGSWEEQMEGGRNYRAAESRKIQQQNANTNAGRAGEQVRHNQVTESQQATNETGRMKRSKSRTDIFGRTVQDETPAPPKAATPSADHTGYVAGQSTMTKDGKKYVYRGVNPSNGKLKWERVE